MAGYLLHEGAKVLCIHTGEAKPTKTDLFVKVSGKPIVTQLPPYTISQCKLPPQGGGPCATALWPKAARQVKASRQPVLLDDNAPQAKCVPTGTPLQTVSTQLHVKGK